MPKRVIISKDNYHWLHAHHARTSYADMARKLKVNIDTLKRILVREGLREFDGAKYAVARETFVELWKRPCMRCKSREQRPKNMYFCKKCRVTLGFEGDDE